MTSTAASRGKAAPKKPSGSAVARPKAQTSARKPASQQGKTLVDNKQEESASSAGKTVAPEKKSKSNSAPHTHDIGSMSLTSAPETQDQDAEGVSEKIVSLAKE